MPTDYTYTGQFSYAGTGGFGLMYYNARWLRSVPVTQCRGYDPALGRFAQADSIIPAGVQGYDRYAYVNNNPLSYTDPSGHICANSEGEAWKGNCNGKSYIGPDEVDSSKLTKASGSLIYSGEMMNELYIEAWNAQMKKKGTHLTVLNFITRMLGFEFQPLGNASAEFTNQLMNAAANWFWCSPNANTNGCTNLRENGGATPEAFLNWIGGMESARRRYNAVINDHKDAYEQIFVMPSNMNLATDVIKFVLFASSASGGLNINAPFSWANLSLPLNPSILGATSGTFYNQFIGKFGVQNPLFILSPCQTAYWKGDSNYVTKVCGVSP